MLEVVQLSHRSQRPGQSTAGHSGLEGVDFIVSEGQLAAVVGTNGLSISLLMEIIAGIRRPDAGLVNWRRARTECGQTVFVGPAQLETHLGINAKEHIVAAAMMRVKGLDSTGAIKLADQLLVLCGLDAARNIRGEHLSEIDRRRLAIAVALVSKPEVVVIDDLVSDLSAADHKRFLVLLDAVRKESPGRVVLHGCVQLDSLDDYDSVVLVHDGRVAFHGPARALTHYFTIKSLDDLFEKLTSRPADRWQDSWNRHRDAYYAKCEVVKPSSGAVTLSGIAKDESEVPSPQDEVIPCGSLPQQYVVQLKRTLTHLRRSYGKRQLIVVSLLSIAGVLAIFTQGTKGAGLTSWFLLQIGLIFAGIVPVVTVAVAGSFSAARGEWRQGVSATAWIANQIVVCCGWAVLLAAVVIMAAESMMGILPGDGGVRGGLLALGGIAFSLLCAGTAAWSKTLDRAQARCWALLAVNLLFSGSLVAWPRAMGALVQPFFTVSQVWGGCMETLKHSQPFGLIEAANLSWFPSPAGAVTVLVVHAAVGFGTLVAATKKA
ncbi:MAG: ATP-binding cassette domain-containing protein [Verrucomicrobiaceae bacterium]|nr:ATP-binding cassette domain-containing protein [Verrucomicrobiaceae bacterium]